MHCSIPYGQTHLALDLPDQLVRGVLIPATEALCASQSEDELVQAALRAPIASPTLGELAVGKRTACIIVSDHTRPVPSQRILPWMLAELRAANPAIEVTLLVATGFHRATTAQELEHKLGHQIASTEKIVIHDSADPAAIISIGTLPSGAELAINRKAVETDLLLAEGFIEPHFFAGFSGGRKSVLPGVCSRRTVLGNHCGEFIASPFARPGVLDGNPLHRDMLAAAGMARLAFVVNVIIDEQKKVVAAFAGDYEKAHRQGCDYLKQFCRVPAAPAEITITSNGGAPLDQNIYQAVKGMCAAEASAPEGGVIIMCAECLDGTGGEDFYQALRDCPSAAELYERSSRIPMSETKPDQWEAQILARIIARHPVIFVTRPEMKNIINDMKMTWAGSLDEALALARGLKGTDAGITVIPNGISVIVD